MGSSGSGSSGSSGSSGVSGRRNGSRSGGTNNGGSSRSSKSWVKTDGQATFGSVAPPETHGPAAEALLEGAEYDAETEDSAGASKAAAAAKTKQLGHDDGGQGK